MLGIENCIYIYIFIDYLDGGNIIVVLNVNLPLSLPWFPLYVLTKIMFTVGFTLHVNTGFLYSILK